MSNLDQRLRELEEALAMADNTLKNENKKEILSKLSNTDNVTTITKFHVIGVSIPFLAILGLYFIKPKFVMITDKKSGKQILCPKRLLMFAFLITIASYLGLYGLKYFKIYSARGSRVSG